MTTTEERMKILRMIEEGKITAAEGARLLSALDRVTAEEAKREAEQPGGARNVRIRVTDVMTGQPRVNVTLPLGLVSFGLRFVPEGVQPQVQSIQQAIHSGRKGRIVEVMDNEDKQRVEIFIE